MRRTLNCRQSFRCDGRDASQTATTQTFAHTKAFGPHSKHRCGRCAPVQSASTYLARLAVAAWRTWISMLMCTSKKKPVDSFELHRDASDSARPMHQFRSSSIVAIWLSLNCRLRVHRHTSVGKGRYARIDARSQLPSNCTVRHKVRRSSASTKSNGANCADKEVLPTRAARRSAVARPRISCSTCVLAGRRASIASNVSCGDQSLYVCGWPGDVGRHDTCNAAVNGRMSRPDDRNVDVCTRR